MVSERKISGAIIFLVNTRSLRFECARVLYDSMLVSILLYGNETMVWREKERSRIRAVQMDNLLGLLGNRRME